MVIIYAYQIPGHQLQWKWSGEEVDASFFCLILIVFFLCVCHLKFCCKSFFGQIFEAIRLNTEFQASRYGSNMCEIDTFFFFVVESHIFSTFKRAINSWYNLYRIVSCWTTHKIWMLNKFNKQHTKYGLWIFLGEKKRN